MTGMRDTRAETLPANMLGTGRAGSVGQDRGEAPIGLLPSIAKAGFTKAREEKTQKRPMK